MWNSPLPVVVPPRGQPGSQAANPCWLQGPPLGRSPLQDDDEPANLGMCISPVRPPRENTVASGASTESWFFQTRSKQVSEDAVQEVTASAAALAAHRVTLPPIAFGEMDLAACKDALRELVAAREEAAEAEAKRKTLRVAAVTGERAGPASSSMIRSLVASVEGWVERCAPAGTGLGAGPGGARGTGQGRGPGGTGGGRQPLGEQPDTPAAPAFSAAAAAAGPGPGLHSAAWSWAGTPGGPAGGQQQQQGQQGQGQGRGPCPVPSLALTVGPLNVPTPGTERDRLRCGVSLAFLQYFAWALPCTSDGAITTREVVSTIVVARTRHAKTRFCDTLPEDVIGYPKYLVSHRWDSPFLPIVAELTRYFEGQDPRLIMLFLDIFSINQHVYSEPLSYMGFMAKVASKVVKVLVIVDEDGLALQRIWVLYEVWAVATAHLWAPGHVLLLGTSLRRSPTLQELHDSMQFGHAVATDHADTAAIQEYLIKEDGSLAAASDKVVQAVSTAAAIQATEIEAGGLRNLSRHTASFYLAQKLQQALMLRLAQRVPEAEAMSWGLFDAMIKGSIAYSAPADIAGVLVGLTDTMLATGDANKARTASSILRVCGERLGRRLGATSDAMLRLLRAAAWAHLRAGLPSQADAAAAELLARHASAPGGVVALRDTACALTVAGLAMQALGRLDDADRALLRAVEVSGRALPACHPAAAAPLLALARLEIACGRHGDACRRIVAARACLTRTFRHTSEAWVDATLTLCVCVEALGELGAAEELLRRLLRLVVANAGTAPATASPRPGTRLRSLTAAQAIMVVLADVHAAAPWYEHQHAAATPAASPVRGPALVWPRVDVPRLARMLTPDLLFRVQHRMVALMLSAARADLDARSAACSLRRGARRAASRLQLSDDSVSCSSTGLRAPCAAGDGDGASTSRPASRAGSGLAGSAGSGDIAAVLMGQACSPRVIVGGEGASISGAGSASASRAGSGLASGAGSADLAAALALKAMEETSARSRRASDAAVADVALEGAPASRAVANPEARPGRPRKRRLLLAPVWDDDAADGNLLSVVQQAMPTRDGAGAEARKAAGALAATEEGANAGVRLAAAKLRQPGAPRTRTVAYPELLAEANAYLDSMLTMHEAAVALALSGKLRPPVPTDAAPAPASAAVGRRAFASKLAPVSLPRNALSQPSSPVGHLVLKQAKASTPGPSSLGGASALDAATAPGASPAAELGGKQALRVLDSRGGGGGEPAGARTPAGVRLGPIPGGTAAGSPLIGSAVERSPRNGQSTASAGAADAGPRSGDASPRGSVSSAAAPPASPQLPRELVWGEVKDARVGMHRARLRELSAAAHELAMALLRADEHVLAAGAMQMVLKVSMRLGGPADRESVGATAWMADQLVARRRFAEARSRLSAHMELPGMTDTARTELRAAVAEYMTVVAFYGVTSNDTALVSACLALGAATVATGDGSQLLVDAARKARHGIVDAILDARPGVVNDEAISLGGATPLTAAAAAGHERVVEQLLRAPGVKVDAGDASMRTPLWHAAQRGHEGVVTMLLSASAKVDLRDADHATALTAAASADHTTVCAVLLDFGALGNVADAADLTPLMHAARLGLDDTVRALLRGGVAAYFRNKAGCTALIYAAQAGRVDVVRQLALAAVGELDECDNLGRTALMHAAMEGHGDVVDVLLEHRANVALAADDGRTALHIAAQGGDARIAAAVLVALAHKVSGYGRPSAAAAVKDIRAEVEPELGPSLQSKVDAALGKQGIQVQAVKKTATDLARVAVLACDDAAGVAAEDALRSIGAVADKLAAVRAFACHPDGTKRHASQLAADAGHADLSALLAAIVDGPPRAQWAQLACSPSLEIFNAPRRSVVHREAQQPAGDARRPEEAAARSEGAVAQQEGDRGARSGAQ
ncbi:hypothetical protein FOA52_015883 [Chlamydomonas sp. UWO 241]|nr:hypothetical protein FOA52_015883 [Chlamydomonas sp. UWO 241]